LAFSRLPGEAMAEPLGPAGCADRLTGVMIPDITKHTIAREPG